MGYRYFFALKSAHRAKDMQLDTLGPLTGPQAQTTSSTAASFPLEGSVRTWETTLKSQKNCEMKAQQMPHPLQIWRETTPRHFRDTLTLWESAFGLDRKGGQFPSWASLSPPSRPRRTTGRYVSRGPRSSLIYRASNNLKHASSTNRWCAPRHTCLGVNGSAAVFFSYTMIAPSWSRACPFELLAGFLHIKSHTNLITPHETSTSDRQTSFLGSGPIIWSHTISTNITM